MSPRLPRDVSGQELAKLLEAFGYAVTDNPQPLGPS